MRFLQQCAGALVIPLALLLCLQWPLRELPGAYARWANDAAQILFALYVAVAVFAASWAGRHIALHATTDAPSDAGVPSHRRRQVAVALCVLPWALFMCWSGARATAASVLSLERFPESFFPGYFVIKLAGWLLMALVVVYALCQLRNAAKARA